MLSFEKLVDLGSAAPHVYVMYQNISDWLTAYRESTQLNSRLLKS